jgi:hypothetical protein
MEKLSKSARSLYELDEEIKALQEKAKRLESQLDESFTYFQENSGYMFVQSIIPKSFEGLLPRTGIKILDTLLESERLQKIIARLADHGANWLGDVLNWLTSKLFKEKE